MCFGPHELCQVALAVLGGLAIRRVRQGRRSGFLLGLLSQPLWIHQTFLAEQWGMVALSFWYAAEWYAGYTNQ